MNGTERVIGGYTLRRVLGRGGMGEVHLATGPTGELAAVKVIHPQLARDPAFRRRFGREVAAARRVARFCTAPLIDAGFDGETAYLVTEYVKGPDLAAAVREQGAFGGSNLEALAVGIATALSSIHGAGVVHRDLKPGNVLLSPLGPRVIDFGIAQLVDSQSVVSQAILGTPAFMAPEQVRGEPVTPLMDVFSWGGVIAFAGTGRLPFGGGVPHEVLYRIVNDGPNLDGLDERLRGLVEWAMAKDPARRPSAQQLLDALVGTRQAAPAAASEVVERTWTVPVGGDGSGTAGRPPSGAAGVPVVSGGGRRRRWPWVAGVAVVLAVAGAAVAVPALIGEKWPYRAEFGQAWAVGATQGGESRVDGTGYVLTAKPGWRLWKSAPRSEPGEGATVSARAKIEEGTGEYGVWCHGTPDAGDRYEFSVNAGGQATIVKRRAGGQPTILYGPAQVKTGAETRIVARCAGDADRVALALWVNGRKIGEAVDTDRPYRADNAGVHAAPAGNGDLRVRFATFTLDPSHP
ncbi:serine/threonine protein kinase [Nonomuraea typhae]|uniref:serine/threonine protein kinase n=1 Tax=Nonomuraea typhae TaxID=2603600 RepID=UPI0012FCDA43|nr:serine/threonine-protein kinase [Nonomuraea typhae]